MTYSLDSNGAIVWKYGVGGGGDFYGLSRYDHDNLEDENSDISELD